MNTRALSDNRWTPSTEIKQQLSFIENVCDLLIRSRFDNGHAEAWAFPDASSGTECGTPFIIRAPLSLDDDFEITVDRSPFAAPLAEKTSEFSEEKDVRIEIVAFERNSDALSKKEATTFPAHLAQPRGSPTAKGKISYLRFEI